MKLCIQIPCFNEAATISQTIEAIPQDFEGIDEVMIVVIDDGSTDETVKVVESLDREVVIERHQRNRGLAVAYETGLRRCLNEGADIIVNTDADNQYSSVDISKLVRPILDRSADFVIGARPILNHPEFSWFKRKLQRLGSLIVRWVSGAPIDDAPSGFRAITREVALSLNVFTGYTYTLETIVQASALGFRLMSIPVAINPATRPSRLVKSNASYVSRSIYTIFRVIFIYGGLKFYLWAAFLSFFMSCFLGFRWLYFLLQESGRTNLPSLFVMVGCLVISVICLSTGLIMDSLAANRKLLAEAAVVRRGLSSNGQRN